MTTRRRRNGAGVSSPPDWRARHRRTLYLRFGRACPPGVPMSLLAFCIPVSRRACAAGRRCRAVVRSRTARLPTAPPSSVPRRSRKDAGSTRRSAPCATARNCRAPVRRHSRAGFSTCSGTARSCPISTATCTPTCRWAWPIHCPARSTPTSSRTSSRRADCRRATKCSRQNRRWIVCWICPMRRSPQVEARRRAASRAW